MKTKRSKAKIGVGQKRWSVICSEPEQKLEVLRPDATGLDCGAEEHYIAVPPDRVRAGEPTVRCFSAFTEGLDAAVDWLKACRISTVAMESTGVYWIALHQKLEAAGIEVYLVNARHVRHVPGRKTDVQDSQWLRQLHRFGLLNASFRPQDIICRLRSLHRHRDNLVSSSASEIQHMQKALQQMNLHLHHVVSDITGLTGLRIIDAILSGQRDPQQLVRLRDRRVYKSTPQEMQAALVGDYRPFSAFHRMGRLAGLVGGLVSMPVMAATGILPKIAGLDSSFGGISGVVIHLLVSVGIGMTYGLLFRNEAPTIGLGVPWGFCLV